MSSRARAARLGLLGALLWATAARAADEPPDVFELRSALKSSFLITRARQVSLLTPDEVTAASFWRLRLEPRVLPAKWITITAAWEQRVRLASSVSALSSPGLPPADTAAPFRVVPLEGALWEGESWSYWHELDRAAVALHLAPLELTVGRQALGWGRGMFFGAVDVFSPFTPLEVDREWRRGVDAVRADVQLSQRASVEVVGVFSDRVDRSALMGRVRGFVGPVDAEVIGGWRAKDVIVGIAGSAVVLDAELHGELAGFVLPTAWAHGGTFGNDRLVLKAVLGGSYQVAVGEGLRVAIEYHYSGFGLGFPVSALDVAADVALRDRLQRGDMQIIGRHLAAASVSSSFGMSVSGTLQVLVDPSDGCGVVAPAVSWDLSDNVSLVGAAYLGWGALPGADLMLNSQLGATPLTVFVQLRVYDQRAVQR